MKALCQRSCRTLDQAASIAALNDGVVYVETRRLMLLIGFRYVVRWSIDVSWWCGGKG